MDDRGLEIIGIRESHGDPDAASFRKLVRYRKQAEDQLHRLPGRDGFQVALIMGMEGQPKVFVGRPAQLAMGSPQVPFGQVGGPAAAGSGQNAAGPARQKN